MAVELDTNGNGAIDIEKGGTNATSAVQALSNLGGQPFDADLTTLSSGTYAQKRAIIESAAKPVLDIDTLRTTVADFDGDVRLLVCHTTNGDGGHGTFRWDASSTAADDNGVTIAVTGVATGRWVRQYEYLTPDMFGAIGNGGPLTDSLAAFQAMADAGTNGCKFVIPAKTYYINGDVEFDIYNYTIEMYGATIIQSGTNNTTFVLNASAMPDESIIRTNIQVRGGWMANTTGYAANTNTAISTRGAFACNIKDVRFIDFGEEAILVGVRDSLLVTECSFYNNYRHIYKDEWITAAGNPQLIYIDKCVASISGAESVLIAGCANEVNIKNTSFIGSDSIVMHTGSAGTSSLSCNIDSCSFEQGAAGGYYVRTQYENAKILRNLNILNSTFQNSDPHAIQLEAVNQANIQGCKFNSNVDGVIDIDANCLNINFGPNEWPYINSYTQGISYACARSAINFYPAETIVTPIALTGYTGAAMSTGTGTLDMSGLVGSYWNRAGRLIPPKAWILKVRARDTGSATSVSTVLIRDVVGTSINEAQGLYLQGTTNNVYRTGTFIIPCDPNGDLFYDVTASGAGSLELRLSIIGYIR